MGATISPVEWDGVLGDITNALSDLPAKVEELAATVEDWLDWLADAIVQGVLDTLEWIANTVEDIIAKVNQALSCMGDPIALWNYASSWTEIAGVCSGSAECFVPNEMATDQHWEGSSANAYMGLLQPQKDALTRLSDGAQKLNTILDKMAIAIVLFWLGVAGVLVKIVGEMVGAGVEAGTGVGIPAAVGTAAWSAGSTWALLGGLWLALETFTVDSVLANLSELENVLSKNEGQWPGLPAGVEDLGNSSQEGLNTEKPDKLPWNMIQEPAAD